MLLFLKEKEAQYTILLFDQYNDAYTLTYKMIPIPRLTSWFT